MSADTIPFNILVLMYSIGFLGVLAHWFKAALKGVVTWNLFKYLIVEQKGNSTSMIFAYAMAMYGLQQIGTFDAITFDYIKEAWDNGYLFKPFLHASIEAVCAGYLCDSAMNKGTPLEPK